MMTQHSTSPFITLCTVLILLCCAVPAQAQSEAPANEQTANVPVEWFTLLPAQAGEAVLVGAKRQSSGMERGIVATYLVQGRDRPEVFELALFPYSEEIRNQIAQFQPMETEELPEGMEAFTGGERGAIALNEQTGYVAFVRPGGPAGLALSDALMRLPVSVLERAGNGAAQTTDSSVEIGIAPLLAALPLRIGRLELMGVEMAGSRPELMAAAMAEGGKPKMRTRVSYAAGPEQDATIELRVCPGTVDACMGGHGVYELTFVREQAPSLVADTTLSGAAVTLIRAGEAGNATGFSNQRPLLFASKAETPVHAFVSVLANEEVFNEQFLEAVEQLDIGALLELAPELPPD